MDILNNKLQTKSINPSSKFQSSIFKNKSTNGNSKSETRNKPIRTTSNTKRTKSTSETRNKPIRTTSNTKRTKSTALEIIKPIRTKSNTRRTKSTALEIIKPIRTTSRTIKSTSETRSKPIRTISKTRRTKSTALETIKPISTKVKTRRTKSHHGSVKSKLKFKNNIYDIYDKSNILTKSYYNMSLDLLKKSNYIFFINNKMKDDINMFYFNINKLFNKYINKGIDLKTYIKLLNKIALSFDENTIDKNNTIDKEYKNLFFVIYFYSIYFNINNNDKNLKAIYDYLTEYRLNLKQNKSWSKSWIYFTLLFKEGTNIPYIIRTQDVMLKINIYMYLLVILYKIIEDNSDSDILDFLFNDIIYNNIIATYSGQKSITNLLSGLIIMFNFLIDNNDINEKNIINYVYFNKLLISIKDIDYGSIYVSIFIDINDKLINKKLEKIYKEQIITDERFKSSRGNNVSNRKINKLFIINLYYEYILKSGDNELMNIFITNINLYLYGLYNNIFKNKNINYIFKKILQNNELYTILESKQIIINDDDFVYNDADVKCLKKELKICKKYNNVKMCPDTFNAMC